MPLFFSRSTALLASAAAAVAYLPAAAHAQTRSFSIPAQSASTGIRAFAQQAGVQVIAASRDTEGRTTNAVHGELDIRAALDQLLAGTDLTVRSFNGKVAILGALPDQATTEAAEAIVVTGSRIGRPELESAMPISVLSFDEAAAVGRTDAYDVLRRSPVISAGNGMYEEHYRSADIGLAAINLRNMGTNRSLALVDGRRRVSGTAASSAVDINMIPPAMIDRIEVVTGGAAAIYGADAVTGAVNIITRKDIEGFNIDAYQGISKYGDAPETVVSLATGGEFDNGRGSFSFGGSYRRADFVAKKDRPFTQNRLFYLPNPDNTGPSDGIPDNGLNRNYFSFFTGDKPGFYIPDNQTFYWYADGELKIAQYDKNWGPPGEFSNGEGANDPSMRNFEQFEPLRNAQESYSFIADVDYEIADGITYNARLDYGRTLADGADNYYREDSRAIFNLGHGSAVARLDNPYMPANVRDLLTSFDLDSIHIDRFYVNFPMIGNHHDRESLTIYQDLSGTIGSSLNWGIFYQYGRTTDDITITNVPRSSRWLAASDVVANPVTGTPECRDAEARAAGCVPYDIFSYRTPLTAEQAAWILYDRHSRRDNDQQIAGAGLNGTLINLPAGDLSFALGAEHRRESATTTEDPLALSGEVANGATITAQQPIDASMNVTEAYGELVIPILRDRPFFRRLEAEGAYRYSDYSSFGSTHTWKVGGTWSPVDGVTIRGVRSRSVRAPNFGELYAPISVGVSSSFNDPCLKSNYNLTPTRAANCAALGVPPLDFYFDGIEIISGGNPDLEPETSNSTTIGLVLQPQFIRGFDLTVDYWDIRIENIITSYSALQMAQFCVDLPDIDNLFCGNMKRGADGIPETISTQLVNAASMEARGIDVGLNYGFPLGAGDLDLNFVGSVLLERETQAIPEMASSIVKYAGGYTDPRFRGSLLINYTIDDFTLSADTRFISASKYDPNVGEEYYEINDVPAKVYNDLAVSYAVDDGMQIGAGVKNVFNVFPPALPGLYAGGGGRYDTMGRYFFTRVGFKF